MRQHARGFEEAKDGDVDAELIARGADDRPGLLPPRNLHDEWAKLANELATRRDEHQRDDAWRLPSHAPTLRGAERPACVRSRSPAQAWAT
jgi:hypothetical protein